MKCVRKTVPGHFWEIQFDGLEAVPDAAGMVHILYAIRKGTAATKREETKRKKRRKKGTNAEKKNAKPTWAYRRVDARVAREKKKKKMKRDGSFASIFCGFYDFLYLSPLDVISRSTSIGAIESNYNYI